MGDVERSYGAQRRQKRGIDLAAATRLAALLPHLLQGPQDPCPIKPLPLTMFAKSQSDITPGSEFRCRQSYTIDCPNYNTSRQVHLNPYVATGVL
jgi:hypothetical protein